MVRISTTKFFMLCSTIIIIFTTQLVFRCNPVPCERQLKEENIKGNHRVDENDYKTSQDDEKYSLKEGWKPHKLAVIVPYRDRFEELLEFAPWIHRFLNHQKIPHELVVINQVDLHRFNRASLINIGYLKTKDKCDYLVMHDVDLLPNNQKLLYAYPEKGPYHLASPEYHPLYHYKTYIGGVLMMTNEHFKMCRGMSTTFWGWGREDDEMYLRFKENKLTLYRPSGLTSGYETFKHIHDKSRRPRDYKRYGEQKKIQFKRDIATGFDTLQYKLESAYNLTIDGAPVTIYNVELHCDKIVTPWCDHDKTQ